MSETYSDFAKTVRSAHQSLLETLTTIGLARTGQLDIQTRYFIPR